MSSLGSVCLWEQVRQGALGTPTVGEPTLKRRHAPVLENFDPRGSWSHIWGTRRERGHKYWGGQSLISTGSLRPLCWEHSLRRGSCLGDMSLIFRLLLVGCGGLASTRLVGISEERSQPLVMGNLRRVWGSPAEGLEPGPRLHGLPWACGLPPVPHGEWLWGAACKACCLRWPGGSISSSAWGPQHGGGGARPRGPWGVSSWWLCSLLMLPGTSSPFCEGSRRWGCVSGAAGLLSRESLTGLLTSSLGSLLGSSCPVFCPLSCLTPVSLQPGGSPFPLCLSAWPGPWEDLPAHPGARPQIGGLEALPSDHLSAVLSVCLGPEWARVCPFPAFRPDFPSWVGSCRSPPP